MVLATRRVYLYLRRPRSRSELAMPRFTHCLAQGTTCRCSNGTQAQRGLQCLSIGYVIAMAAAVGRLPSRRPLHSPRLKRLQAVDMALLIPSALSAHSQQKHQLVSSTPVTAAAEGSEEKRATAKLHPATGGEAQPIAIARRHYMATRSKKIAPRNPPKPSI